MNLTDKNSIMLNSYSKLIVLIFLLLFPWVGIPLYPYLMISLIISFFIFFIFYLRFKKIILLYGIFLFFYSFIIFIFSKEHSVFLYTFTIILSYILISKEISNYIRIKKRKIYYIAIIVSFILINFSWQLHKEDRYAVFVGDANFSAFWLLLILFSLITSLKSNSKFIKLLILLSSFFIVWITRSRMGFLSILLFFSTFYLKNFKKLRLRMGFLLLFFSMYGQLIGYYFFLNFIKIQNLNVESIFDRLFNLNDTSNLLRVNSYYYALNKLLLNKCNFLFGVPDYFKHLPYDLSIPHNWYIGMSVFYGFIYSTMFTIFIIYLIVKMQNEFTPLLYTIIFMSGILNINGVSIPLLLISLLYFINHPCND